MLAAASTVSASSVNLIASARDRAPRGNVSTAASHSGVMTSCGTRLQRSCIVVCFATSKYVQPPSPNACTSSASETRLHASRVRDSLVRRAAAPANHAAPRLGGTSITCSSARGASSSNSAAYSSAYPIAARTHRCARGSSVCNRCVVRTIGSSSCVVCMAVRRPDQVELAAGWARVPFLPAGHVPMAFVTVPPGRPASRPRPVGCIAASPRRVCTTKAAAKA